MTRAEATKALIEGKQVERVTGAYSHALEWHEEHGMIRADADSRFNDGVTYRLTEPEREPRVFLGRWIECSWHDAEPAGTNDHDLPVRLRLVQQENETLLPRTGGTLTEGYWVKRIEQPAGIPVKELRNIISMDIVSTLTPMDASRRRTFDILSTLCDKYEPQPAPEPRDKRRD